MPSEKAMDRAVRARLREWLVHYKVRRHWTNKRLAQELGVTEPTVTMVLNGTRTAGLDLLVKMHRGLCVSADDLLDVDPVGQGKGARSAP